MNGDEIVNFKPVGDGRPVLIREYSGWKLEQPAHAAANGYFCTFAINRVGTEGSWNIGEILRTELFP